MDNIKDEPKIETKQEAYDRETSEFMAELEGICRKYQRVVTPRLHYTDTGIMPILSHKSTNPEYGEISEDKPQNANVANITLEDILKPGDPL